MLSRKSKITAIGLFTFLILVPTYVSFVSSATGYIRINGKSTSAPFQQVPVGGNVSLYFGEVSWSGSEFYLLLSHDISPQVSPGDYIYTPLFSVSNLTNMNATSYYSTTYGFWKLGSSWVNGSIPINTPIGNYSIKAFDSISSVVAVTDVLVGVYTVNTATLQISPPSGPGGAQVQFTGTNYPPGRAINITYYDYAFGLWRLWNTTTADTSGHISFSTVMPDLKQSLGNGDYLEGYTSMSFRTEIDGAEYSSTRYDQYQRGLKSVGNQTASGLFGNGTNLASSVSVKSGDTLAISGKWFHPGDAIYIRWDGTPIVNTVTGNEWRNATIIGQSIASSSGSFNAVATIPFASSGEHFVAVEDSQTTVIIRVLLTLASLQVSPSSGAGGVYVQFSGEGYPANSAVNISYSDPNLYTWNFWNSTLSDSLGRISVFLEIPDLQKSQPIGDSGSEYASTLSFRTEIDGLFYGTAVYREYQRGLKIVGPATAAGLYGNGTNLYSTVKVKVGDVIVVSGKWFHPHDVIYVRWDGTAVVGTVTGDEWRNAQILATTIASASGAFNTTITIPTADTGEHYLAFEDSQNKVIIKILLSSGTLQITPSSGPGGASVQFLGSGYQPSSQVNITYLDQTYGTWNFWRVATANASGAFSFSSTVPDLGKSLTSGDNSEQSNQISFRTEVGGIAYSYADFSQNYRGIKRVGSQTASGLYGNGTNLSSSVTVAPGDALTISGRWFRPGVVYIRWDGTAVVGTVTGDEWRNAVIIGSPIAGSTGSFETSVTIPTANVGEHYIAVEDPQMKIILKVNVKAAPPPQNTTTTTTTTTNNSSQTNPTPTPPSTKPTPTISLSCKGTSTSGGLKVDIRGSLSLNGTAIPGADILVSYFKAGKSWESLTLVNTGSDGGFGAVWMPSVSGNYMIKAEYEGSSTMNVASTTVSLILDTYSEENAEKSVFTMISNSTITEFEFNSVSNVLSFVASGPEGTRGYVSIYIPKSLIGDISNLKAYIDETPVQYTSEEQTDSWRIQFEYSHSEHKVTLALGPTATATSNDNPLGQWLIYIIPTAVIAAIAAAGIAFARKRKNTTTKTN